MLNDIFYCNDYAFVVTNNRKTFAHVGEPSCNNNKMTHKMNCKKFYAIIAIPAIIGLMLFVACSNEEDRFDHVRFATKSSSDCEAWMSWSHGEYDHLLKLTEPEKGIVEWRCVEDGIFLFDSEVRMDTTNRIETFSDVTSNGFTANMSDGLSVKFAHVQDVGAVTTFYILCESDSIFVTVSNVDSIGLLQAINMAQMQQAPIPPIIWRIVIEIGKELIEMAVSKITDCEKQIMRAAANCTARGCVPFPNTASCSVDCRKYVGTPSECSCDTP